MSGEIIDRGRNSGTFPHGAQIFYEKLDIKRIRMVVINQCTFIYGEVALITVIAIKG
jgi:hypothetical protein